MKIEIIHASAGHGHQRVAEAVRQTFLDRGVISQNILLRDILDKTPWYFSKPYPAIYYNSVRYTPMLWGWVYEALDHKNVYRLIRPFRSLGNRIVGTELVKEALAFGPDVIISTHFYPAQFFGRLKKEGKLKAKLITVITDYYPHTFWVNPGTDFYWVMCEEGKYELQRRGVPEKHIVAGGIPVAAHFKPMGQKSEYLRQWGFQKDRLTLLMTSGSFGLGPQEEILKNLAPFKSKIQCFVVCGNNLKLRANLEKQNYEFPVKIFGFIDFMPELMEASDLIVAKSGGSTTTESLVKGVPMIVMHPIPGQETRNAHLLRERNAAFFIQNPDQIKLIIETILKDPKVLEAKRKAIYKLGRPNAADDLVSFALKGKRP